MLTSLAVTAGAQAAGPLTWGPEQPIDPGKTIEAIDCPATTLCVASDGSGNMIASANPGAAAPTWTVTAVNPTVNIENVSCPSTTLCLAVDYGGNVWWSTDPAALVPTWTAANIAPAVQLQSLDCASATLCLAGGRSNGTIYWSTDPTGGVAQWHPVAVDPPAREISALSCPTVAFCIFGEDSLGPPGPAVFWTTNPTSALATDWTKTASIDADPVNGGSVIEGMSCPTASFCVGSDDLGNVLPSLKPSGARSDWVENEIGGFATFWNISCPSTTLCVTAGGNTTWTSTDPAGAIATWATDVLNGTSLDAVSCASPGFCAVAGRNVVSGNGVVYIGTQAALTVAVGGAGNGSVSGNGISCPGVCSLFYPLATGVKLTATPAADGSTFAGWSGDCTGTGDCLLSMASDRATTATFDPAPPPAPPATTSSNPPSDPTPAPAADLPPPVESKNANAYPASGTVLVRASGSKSFVPLAQPRQVQFGATFDTRHGAVRIVIDNGHGGFDAATFSEGVFKLVQVGKFAELDLAGGNFKGCPKAAKGGAAKIAASTRGRSVRHLWGEGAGSFRTKGRFASATIRGTRWLTDDRCLGTLVKVATGAVTVRDLVTKRSLALKAPKSYFAASRR